MVEKDMKMTEHTTILKQHKGYWIGRLRSLVHQGFEERLKKYGISVASWCVLVSVYDNSARSTSDLAQYIEIDKAAISRIIEKLAQKGLLIQTVGKDKRTGSISLTQKGLNLVPQLMGEAEDNERVFFSELTMDEQDSLKQIMQKILIKSSKIRLDGWLKLINEEKQTVSTIKEILIDSIENKWPFPKTFQMLKDAGLQRCTIYFSDSYKSIYEGSFGTFKGESLQGYTPLETAQEFSAEDFKNALMYHIKNNTHYLEFLKDAARCGVSHYRVDMNARTVTYYNPDESQSHIEVVPTID